mmetsp:Transcript_21294/g.65993  ORF Transcript_21294/g.65993 Transcript_21294/m.65993 type:complete len:229 (-) Transcript_21294:791-1477(-)
MPTSPALPHPRWPCSETMPAPHAINGTAGASTRSIRPPHGPALTPGRASCARMPSHVSPRSRTPWTSSVVPALLLGTTMRPAQASLRSTPQRWCMHDRRLLLSVSRAPLSTSQARHDGCVPGWVPVSIQLDQNMRLAQPQLSASNLLRRWRIDASGLVVRLCLIRPSLSHAPVCATSRSRQARVKRSTPDQRPRAHAHTLSNSIKRARHVAQACDALSELFLQWCQRR